MPLDVHASSKSAPLLVSVIINDIFIAATYEDCFQAIKKQVDKIFYPLMVLKEYSIFLCLYVQIARVIKREKFIHLRYKKLTESSKKLKTKGTRESLTNRKRVFEYLNETLKTSL